MRKQQMRREENLNPESASQFSGRNACIAVLGKKKKFCTGHGLAILYTHRERKEM